MVDSGPDLPVLEIWDKLRLPDFSSDIDPGPRESFQRSGSILAWPVFIDALAEVIGRSPSFADDFATGSGKPCPRYGGALWVQDLLGAMEKKVLLRELEAGLHVLTCTNGEDRNTSVLWPESAWRSDLVELCWCL